LPAFLNRMYFHKPLKESLEVFGWHRTVNIDWPKNREWMASKKNMKKGDYLELLRFFYQKIETFNAAIVQVQTAGDAFYDSDYCPFSLS